VKRIATYLIAAVVIALAPLLVPNAYYVHVGQVFAYTAIAVIGLNILLGLSGQMSLGQSGFYALGAYGSAILATTYQWPLFASMLVGFCLATLAGVLVGLVALRTRGLYLAMATLAFGFIIEILAQRWVSLTGGTMGLMAVPQIDYGSFKMGPTYFFWSAAGLLLLVQIASDYVFDSAFGRRLRAIKESEAFAATTGLNVRLWRTVVFAASAMLAGVSGILFAHMDGYLSSDAFNIKLTVSLLIATVIGGLGFSYGPLLGTAILLGVAEILASLPDIGQIIYGAILLVVLLLFPEGAIGLIRRVARIGATSVKSALPSVGPGFERLSLERSPPATLSITALSKTYAGVTALKDVSLSIRPGTVHALIGPNGAGKSTFINVVAGLYRADSGRIELNGRDITAASAHQRARMGIVRTFQNLQLIDSVDVLSNVMLGVAPRQGVIRDFGRWVVGAKHEAAERSRAYSLLDSLGLAGIADQFPRSLSYGHRKLVELARAMAQAPSVLLLDEPVAGLNPEEAREIASVVRLLREAGVAVLLVEHNMEFVMSISDSVTVLDFGHLIAAGEPRAVQNNPLVQQVYLGTESLAS
jgi:ABC-type branched-subunit amino acid transport system ATPase component/ABC-type branched-subunit amino acid transport system permease subunit